MLCMRPIPVYEGPEVCHLQPQDAAETVQTCTFAHLGDDQYHIPGQVKPARRFKL